MPEQLFGPFPLVTGSATVQRLHSRVRREIPRATVLTILAVEGELLVSDRAARWRDPGETVLWPTVRARLVKAALVRSSYVATHYYTGDANFNVTAALDAATGAVVERYVYTAHGAATVYDEDWSNRAAPSVDGPLYAGYFFDAETALYQVRNRYYDSSLSTFISRDPVGYFLSDTADDGYGNVWPNTPGSVINADFVAGNVNDFNLYRYVGNSPLAKNDPSGLHTHDDCDRWYDQCGDVCRRMPNKTWWDRNRRRMCWAACFAEYATCISTCEETVKCAVVGGACVAAGALVLCDGPLPIGDACAAGIVGAAFAPKGTRKGSSRHVHRIFLRLSLREARLAGRVPNAERDSSYGARGMAASGTLVEQGVVCRAATTIAGDCRQRL